MSRPVESFNEFISAKMMIVAGMQNVNEFRKYSGEEQFCSLLYALKSKEEM